MEVDVVEALVAGQVRVPNVPLGSTLQLRSKFLIPNLLPHKGRRSVYTDELHTVWVAKMVLVRNALSSLEIELYLTVAAILITLLHSMDGPCTGITREHRGSLGWIFLVKVANATRHLLHPPTCGAVVGGLKLEGDGGLRLRIELRAGCVGAVALHARIVCDGHRAADPCAPSLLEEL